MQKQQIHSSSLPWKSSLFSPSESENTKMFISYMILNSIGFIMHQNIRQALYNANPCSNFTNSQVATDTCVNGQYIICIFWAYKLIAHALCNIFIHYTHIKISESRLALQIFHWECPKFPRLLKSHHLWIQLTFQSHSHDAQAKYIAFMCILCQKCKVATDTRVSDHFIKMSKWLHQCITLSMYINCFNYAISKFTKDLC